MGIATFRTASLAATILAATFGAAVARAGVDVSLVTELQKNEPYEGHVFHDGLLWETNSRQNDTDPHRVDIYDAQGTVKVGSVALEHSASFIYPYSDHQVLVVGKSATPYWLTHFTVITHNGSSFSARRTTFPEQYMIDRAAGDHNALFFNEPGSRGVYSWSGGQLQAVGSEVSGPGPMSYDGNDLWVIESRGFQLGDEGLVRINPATNATDRTFGNANRAGLTDIKALDRYPWVALSETLANQILFVDKATNTLAHTIAVAEEPRGLTQLGGCLVVTSEKTKVVTFIGLWGDAPHVIDQWDVSGAGDRLKKPSGIAVSAQAGKVFLRSSSICPTCASTQSSVFAAAQADGETFRKCLANAQ